MAWLGRFSQRPSSELSSNYVCCSPPFWLACWHCRSEDRPAQRIGVACSLRWQEHHCLDCSPGPGTPAVPQVPAPTCIFSATFCISLQPEPGSEGSSHSHSSCGTSGGPLTESESRCALKSCSASPTSVW